MTSHAPWRLTSLHVQNFRSLKDFEMTDMTALTVLTGANGAGKSTVLDVFSFLGEIQEEGDLKAALARRGGLKELRSRGSSGPVSINLRVDGPKTFEYAISLDDPGGVLEISQESLRYGGQPVFELSRGKGRSWPSKSGAKAGNPEAVHMAMPQISALAAIGSFETHWPAHLFAEYLKDWRLYTFAADDMRGTPDSGAEEWLLEDGSNLANVIQHLSANSPEDWNDILRRLCVFVPQLENVYAEALSDSRVMLRFKDAAFDQPFPVRAVSEGTLKLLACLVLFAKPDPAQLAGLEEPENFVHPRLLYELAEQCQFAAERRGFIVSTHSPEFVNGVEPEQVQVLYRGDDGFARVRRASDIPGVPEMMAEAGRLGDLWMEGYLGHSIPGTS